jgi:hypothetical protein
VDPLEFLTHRIPEVYAALFSNDDLLERVIYVGYCDRKPVYITWGDFLSFTEVFLMEDDDDDAGDPF